MWIFKAFYHIQETLNRILLKYVSVLDWFVDVLQTNQRNVLNEQITILNLF